MNQDIIADLKSFDWQKIIDYGNSLGDLNNAQLRFLKGLAAETCVEQMSNGEFTYVGLPHKDFDWNKYNASVELKSIFSKRMYNLKGEIKSLPGIRLSNSYGTNVTTTLDPINVADILIAVVNDGAFAVSKETVLSKAQKKGDGWMLWLTKDDIVELSGYTVTKNKYNTHLAESIRSAIKQSIATL